MGVPKTVARESKSEDKIVTEYGPRSRINKNAKNQYKCRVCKMSYKNKSELWNHNRTHFPVRHCSCENCTEIIETPRGERSVTVPPRTRSLLTPYQCLICERTFRKEANLRIHLHEHVRNMTECELPITPTKKRCFFGEKNECTQLLDIKYPIDKNIFIDCDRKYTQKFCSKVVKNIENLTLHEHNYRQYLKTNNGRSNKNSNIKCRECGKRFTKKSKCKTHVRFTHLKNPCPGRKSQTWHHHHSTTLTTESLSMGDSKYPHFTGKRNYNQKQTSGSEQRSLKCEKCGKKFKLKLNLKKHIKYCLSKKINKLNLKVVQPDLTTLNLNIGDMLDSNEGKKLKEILPTSKSVVKLPNVTVDLLTSSNQQISPKKSTLIPTKLVVPYTTKRPNQNICTDLICFHSEIDVSKTCEYITRKHLQSNLELLGLPNNFIQLPSPTVKTNDNGQNLNELLHLSDCDFQTEFSNGDNSKISFQVQTVLYGDDSKPTTSPTTTTLPSSLSSNLVSIVKTTVEFPLNDNIEPKTTESDAVTESSSKCKEIKLIDCDQFQCTFCKKVFWREKDYLNHKTEHCYSKDSSTISQVLPVEKPQPSKQCLKVRPDVHPALVPNKKSSFTCTKCTNKFVRGDNLKKQMEKCKNTIFSDEQEQSSQFGSEKEITLVQGYPNEILFKNRFMSKSTLSDDTMRPSSLNCMATSHTNTSISVKSDEIHSKPLTSKFSTYVNIVANTFSLLEKSLTDAERNAYVKKKSLTKMSVTKIKPEKTLPSPENVCKSNEVPPVQSCAVNSKQSSPSILLKKKNRLSNFYGSYATNPLHRPVSSSFRGQILNCDVCNKPFRNINSLLQHKKTHRLLPYTCGAGIANRFSTASELSVHETLYKQDLPFKCQICDNDFASQAKLRYHILNTHRQVTIYECDICEKIFMNSETLIEHRKTHDKDVFQCSICEQLFDTDADMKYHTMTKHYKNIKCEICCEQFSTYSELNLHTKTDHQYSRFYKCSLCESSFSSIKEMMSHRTLHPKHREEFSCNVCKVSYARDNDLYTHFANVHHDQ